MHNPERKLPFSHEQIMDAIHKRHSTRRFRREPLAGDMLDAIQSFVPHVAPLCPENRFHCEIRTTEGVNLKDAIGAYGNIVNPPHFLAPYILGRQAKLTDLGYRVQQMVVFLTAAGIDTCYLGAITRQAEARAALGLPDDALIGAVVIFGQAASGLADQAVDKLIHTMARAGKRLPLDTLFHNGSFDHPQNPPDRVAKLVKAGRSAPSAVNAQPWRFLLAEQLYLFVKRSNPRYGNSKDYRYYDAGVCMANVSLAAGVPEIQTRWELFDPDSASLPEHPNDLELIARMEL